MMEHWARRAASHLSLHRVSRLDTKAPGLSTSMSSQPSTYPLPHRDLRVVDQTSLSTLYMIEAANPSAPRRIRALQRQRLGSFLHHPWYSLLPRNLQAGHNLTTTSAGPLSTEPSEQNPPLLRARTSSSPCITRRTGLAASSTRQRHPDQVSPRHHHILHRARSRTRLARSTYDAFQSSLFLLLLLTRWIDLDLHAPTATRI